MNAQIEIKRMMVWTILGVLPEERQHRRPVVITILMQSDIARPVKTDALGDAIDYSCVQAAVVTCVEKSSFQLLESLAARIAEVVLTFEGISKTTVRVEKPNALTDCEGVAVILRRERC